MAHKNTNQNQVLDILISTGVVDGPYSANGEDTGQIITDQAQMTVEQETSTTE